jgi:3-deoxy-manno-octulosonate cytidylyltransferase (CMP-KDO synthetase)
MENNIAIIPARMASTRFPGKPLKMINGKPMIGHVYANVRACNFLKETYVATCDEEIAQYIKSIGGKYIMTSDKHQRASDRTAEAMLKAEQLLKTKLDIIVMVQGDEPMVTSPMIEKSLLPFKDKNINIVNLMTKINSIEEFEDPNEPKVVVDLNSNAIYFSREPIPSRKKGIKNVPMFKQVCVIPFRRDYLIEYNTLPETALERIESIDMNRIIENGDKIRMVEITGPIQSVDTENDLKIVSNLIN